MMSVRVRRYMRRHVRRREGLETRPSSFAPSGYEIKDIYLDGKRIGDYKLSRGRFGMAEIESIWLNLEHQRKGIGREVVEDIMQELKAEGFETVRITAAPSAVGFWERMGFYSVDEDGECPDCGMEHTEVRMEALLE